MVCPDLLFGEPENWAQGGTGATISNFGAKIAFHAGAGDLWMALGDAYRKRRHCFTIKLSSYSIKAAKTEATPVSSAWLRKLSKAVRDLMS